MADIKSIFLEAVALHQSGDLTKSKHLYQQYLTSVDDIVPTLTNLGAIYIDEGNYLKAHQLLDAAIALNPTYPEALSNKGYLFLLESNVDEALLHLSKALQYSPALVPALKHHSQLTQSLERPQDSLQYLTAAYEANPSSFQIVSLLCTAHAATFGLSSALHLIESEIRPSNQCTSFHLSSVIANLHLTYNGDLVQALHHFSEAIDLNPSPPLADLINKGEVLRKLSNYDEAESWIHYIQDLYPEDSTVHNLNACLLQDVGRFDEALFAYELSINRNPSNPTAYANKAFLLSSLGRQIEAKDLLEKALKLDSLSSVVHHSLARLFFNLADHTKALHHFKQACSLNPSSKNLWDNYLYFLCFTRVLTGLELRSEFDSYYLKYLKPLVESISTNSNLAPLPAHKDRLKVGILSGEIGDHAVGHFLLSLLRGSDSLQLPIDFYLLCTVERPNDRRYPDFLKYAHSFFSLKGKTDSQSAQAIRDLGLHLVLDTSHHMDGNRCELLQYRLAPIQAHYIGVHGSTAIPNVDFFIGDKIYTPSTFQHEFVEKIAPLPRTFVAYDSPSYLPDITYCETQFDITFGCFNNASKISLDTLRLWSHVLLAFPDSGLYLKDAGTRSNQLPSDALTQITDYFVSSGISPDRIVLLPRVSSWYEHMTQYNKIDISLDTTPLNSGTTAFDSLSMGVPIVSYTTPWLGGRMSESILHGLSQSSWSASTPEDYVSVLSAEVIPFTLLDRSRHLLRERFLSSSLCDAEDLASSIYILMRDMIAQKVTHSPS